MNAFDIAIFAYRIGAVIVNALGAADAANHASLFVFKIVLAGSMAVYAFNITRFG